MSAASVSDGNPQNCSGRVNTYPYQSKWVQQTALPCQEPQTEESDKIMKMLQYRH